jgi:hypothetical protein
MLMTAREHDDLTHAHHIATTRPPDPDPDETPDPDEEDYAPLLNPQPVPLTHFDANDYDDDPNVHAAENDPELPQLDWPGHDQQNESDGHPLQEDDPFEPSDDFPY